MNLFLWRSLAGVLFGGILMRAAAFSALAQGNPFQALDLVLPSPTSGTLNTVIYDGRGFLAAGSEPQAVGSPDGKAWSVTGRFLDLEATLALPSEIVALGHGNGVYLGFGIALPICFYSADGRNWTTNAFISTRTVPQILHANGRFLIRIGSSALLSQDGKVFASIPTSSVPGLIDAPAEFMATDGKRFLYLMPDRKLMQSTDAAVWTEITPTLPGWKTVSGIQYLTDQWFAGGTNGIILSSRDGLNWEERRPEAPGQDAILASGGFHAGNSYFPKGRTNFWISEGGASWAPITNPVPKQTRSLASGRDIAVACGADGFLAYSTNGLQWTVVSRPASFPFITGDAFNGKLIATEYTSNRVLTTVDRVNWYTNRLPVTAPIVSSVIGAQGAVVCGKNGELHYSRDLASWQPAESQPPGKLGRVHFLNDLYVALGTNGTVLTSIDASHWVEASKAPALQSNLALGWFKGRYVCMDVQGYLWVSKDLSHWDRINTLVPPRLPGGYGIHIVVSDSKLLIAFLEDTAVTEDLITWQFGGMPASSGANDIVWGNGFFLAASPSGTFRYSRDGLKWTRWKASLQVTEDLSFDRGLGRFVGVTLSGGILQSRPVLSMEAAASNPIGFRVYGDPQAIYQIESRDSLEPGSEWQPEASIQLLTNPTLWHPSGAEARSRRFFQLRTP